VRLIAALHESARRLEELTAGQVDSVLDHQGRAFLLLSAQDYLRQSDVATQSTVLNELQAPRLAKGTDCFLGRLHAANKHSNTLGLESRRASS
jgi:hypothetical protein